MGCYSCLVQITLSALCLTESEAWGVARGINGRGSFSSSFQVILRRRHVQRTSSSLNGEANQNNRKAIEVLFYRLQQEDSFEYEEMLEQHDELSHQQQNALDDDASCSSASPPFPRQQHVLPLDNNKQAAVCSRTIPITSSWNITVWEWQTVAPVIETYWQVEQQGLQVSSNTNHLPHLHRNKKQQQSSMLDPFGLVTWPGSVVASLELLRHQNLVKDKTILVIGSGVGVEAQAAAVLGAKHVLATDIHPTTLKLLEYGVQQAQLEQQIECRIWDLFGTDPMPTADVIVCADVLYNDRLANQLIKRISQVYRNKKYVFSNNDEDSSDTKDTTLTANTQHPITLIVDSQRFCQTFEQDLNAEMRQIGRRRVAWQSRYLPTFTGSGVLVDEDQSYDVKARVLWIGL